MRLGIHRVMVGACVAASLALGAGKTAASVVFSDNFDAETVPTPPGWIANDASFANFFVQDGTVDLLGPANPFGLTGVGNFVDLDGSTDNGGVMETIRQFDFSAGSTVTLDLLVSVNQRGGSDTLFGGFRFFSPRSVDNVSLSGFTSFQEPNLPTQELLGIASLSSGSPYQVYSISFHALTNGTISALIGTDSADNVGPLLDGVTITDVPEPAAWSLMIAGFGLLGATLRTRRRLAPA